MESPALLKAITRYSISTPRGWSLSVISLGLDERFRLPDAPINFQFSWPIYICGAGRRAPVFGDVVCAQILDAAHDAVEAHARKHKIKFPPGFAAESRGLAWMEI